MRNKRIVAIGLAIFLGGCSTITIHPKSTQKQSSNPTYDDSRPFFFWGLVGEERVDVKEICSSSDVKQMQSQQTFVNGLLTGITLGIYAPHSVKVWCG